MHRRTFTASLAAAAITTTGCFGSFRGLNWVYDFNKGVSSSKVVQWLVFLALVIIPVYEIAALVDILILNSLEFWGMAQNGALDSDKRVVQLSDDHTLHLRKDIERGLLFAEIEGPGRFVALRFEMSDEEARVFNGDRLVALARPSRAGGVDIVSGGRIIERFDESDVAALLDAHHSGDPRTVATWASARRGAQDVATR